MLFLAISFARINLDFSPPERERTGALKALGSNKNSFKYPATCLGIPLTSIWSALPGSAISGAPAKFSCRLASILKLPLSWSKLAILKFVPLLIVPSSGVKSLNRIFNSVVFPTPFAPTKAIRSPREIVTLNLPHIGFPSIFLLIDCASNTFRPEISPDWKDIFAVSWRFICKSFSSLSSFSAFNLPWFLLRLAEIPSTAHTDSSFMRRFNLWLRTSSSAQVLSRQSSKSAKFFSFLRRIPLSNHKVVLDTARRNALSWLIVTIPHFKFLNRSSSHWILSISRWLVGASKSIKSGVSAIIFANAARLISPPDANFTSCLRFNFSPLLSASIL